jgi:hypothetical protein
MTADLGTTNLLLGIMAAVSVLEALLIIGAGVAGFMVYKKMMVLTGQVMTLAQGIEARQVAPAMMRVNAILDDVKGVTATVKHETERVDNAIHSTIDRIDDTADRVRSNVRAKTSSIAAFVRGARAVLEGMLHRSEVRT